MTSPDDRTRAAPRPDTAQPTLTVAAPPARPDATCASRPFVVAAGGLPDVPGYAVSRELARGGMGVVYAAADPAFGREVAVKVMHPGQDADRFVVESKVTAQLPHPGVPPVYALGALADGRPFLAMKLVEGRTLADELKAGADLPRLLALFERICDAVGFAHSRGVVHRDLKPANIMVGAFGEVYVMDWGLAKVWASGTEDAADGRPAAAGGGAPGTPDETVAGQVKGTPAYMAPEQARGEPVGPPADVFALGGILAVMLTGKPPFAGTTVLDTVLMAAQAELAVCFAQFDSCGADPELVAVAKRCLAPAPAARFVDGKAVAGAVTGYRAGVEERLRRAERDRAVQAAEAREQRKRRRVQLALAAFVLCTAAGGGGLAWYADRQAAGRKAEHEREAAERRAAEARAAGERDAEARNKEGQARDGVRANRALADDLRRQFKFAPAEVALGQAAEAAKGGPPELAAEVARARDDLALVVRLDDIRYRKWAWTVDEDGKGSFNTKGAPREYREAFAARGLDPAGAAPDAAAARLAASAVRAELVAAMDDWATYEPDTGLQGRLLDVARRADPGTWTDRLRDPAVRGDKAAVERLAADADIARTPPAALVALTAVMATHGLSPEPLLTAARVKHPADFELAFALGRWLTFNGGNDRAVGPYEAARAVRPENLVAWNNLGVVLRVKGDLDGAAAVCRETIRINPRYALAHANLGTVLRLKGDVAGALDLARQAVRLDPTSAAAHRNLGAALHAAGDRDGAVAAYREAVAVNPKDAAAHHALGVALKGRGDRDGALAALREAVALAPTSAGAHHALGMARSDAGDRDGAVASYREALRLNPRLASAHNSLGTALHAAGDRDGAAAAFRASLVIDPGSAYAHDWLGLVLRAKGEWAAAAAAYREAARLEPGNAGHHNGLGLSLRDKGDLPGAIAAFREGIRADPKNVYPYNNLGSALRAAGDLGGAADAFEGATRADPKGPHGFCNLGNALRDRGDPAGAAEAFRACLALDPTFTAAHNGLGLSLRSLGDAQGAVAAFRRTVELDPKGAYARWNLGNALRDAGALDESLTAYRDAVRLDPKHPSAPRSLAQAERLRDLLPRLPDVLAGTSGPVPAELCDFAHLCARPFQQKFAAAVGLYEKAAAAGPVSGTVLSSTQRYDAACHAARAARGDGADAPADPAARAALRAKALRWLRAELALRQKLAAASAAERKVTADKMALWLRDADLSAVRHPFRLAPLPAAEADAWLAFWAEVRMTRDDALKGVTTAPPPRPAK